MWSKYIQEVIKSFTLFLFFLYEEIGYVCRWGHLLCMWRSVYMDTLGSTVDWKSSRCLAGPKPKACNFLKTITWRPLPIEIGYPVRCGTEIDGLYVKHIYHRSFPLLHPPQGKRIKENVLHARSRMEKKRKERSHSEALQRMVVKRKAKRVQQ